MQGVRRTAFGACVEDGSRPSAVGGPAYESGLPVITVRTLRRRYLLTAVGLMPFSYSCL